LGGMIVLALGLCEHPSIASGGLNPVGVSFSGELSGINVDAIDYGYLPHVLPDDLTDISYSFWMNIRSIKPNAQLVMSTLANGLAGQSSGFAVEIYSTGTISLAFVNTKFDDTWGFWSVPNPAFTLNALHHVLITYHIDVDEDPIIYIDGVRKTVVEDQTPIGNLKSSVGALLVLGSYKNNAGNYSNSTDGILYDPRIYHRILTPSEAVALYNAGVVNTSLVTEGIVFQGLAINSDLGDASSLNGQQIPTGNKFFENILRMVGETHGSPLINQ